MALFGVLERHRLTGQCFGDVDQFTPPPDFTIVTHLPDDNAGSSVGTV